MNQGKFVFSQIMDRMPWWRFQTCVDRYHGDRNIQTFHCTDYFRVMAFAQLTYRESLRDIIACPNAIPEKLYHMGIRSGISRNNLSNATKQRDWRIFADFVQILIRHARELYQNDSARIIADLYRSRWQVELFFKWIKQHLRIKTFYGISENAVKSQIWIAVSVYLLVAILKKELGLPQSLYQILQIFSLTQFEKTPIFSMFERKFDNSQNNPFHNQPTLFEL